MALKRRLCRDWVNQNCSYSDEKCWHKHDKDRKKIKTSSPFNSYLFYPVKAELEKLVDVAWYIVEHEFKRGQCVVVFLEDSLGTVAKRIESAKEEAINGAIHFMGASINKYFSTPEGQKKEAGLEIVTTLSCAPETPPEKNKQVVPPTKNEKSLKFWRVKEGSTDVHEILQKEDLKPTLRPGVRGTVVTAIEKAESPKPVSALDSTCTTKIFAERILPAHKSEAPRIVCSGSTLSQILNWFMKLYYNCDRPLICFEKLDDGSIWAHSLYDDKVPTTQSDEGMFFATSVENFLLQDVPKREYVYASSVIKFDDLNLLTYFEVDGFENGKPVEIKTQKSHDQFKQRNSVTSIENSHLFAVKNNYLYLHYKWAELKGSTYQITSGSLANKSSIKPTDNSPYLPMLSDLLHQVLDILSDADVDAVILQFIYTKEKIIILRVTKNGRMVDESWRDDLGEVKDPLQLDAPTQTATDEEKPANEQQDQMKHQPAQEENDGYEQVSYKNKKPLISAPAAKKSNQGRSNTNPPKKPQESKSNTNQTNNSYAALLDLL